eukprot:CAMPEP_0183310868 /NCGR_PEP_ID=MMETSP0160_2-20130417/33734_1 /TAXON_ID=2839 ORGANISM="Odontella Sinensis, Strain Grunow 1884" /NCGR_SAMPLE_ID=MMETSP0160_2 /ASSEMBLY_ACC=CAM_ASM_000250 /LENGTH=46 /DNA_ID= /DNA_START= /DNA_END= /DNA_ORIENTATION=
MNPNLSSNLGALLARLDFRLALSPPPPPVTLEPAAEATGEGFLQDT